MPEILIIHLTRLGDLVQSNRTVLELKESMPDSPIDFFALEEFASALRGLPLRRVYLISFEDLQTLHRNLDNPDIGSLWSAGDTIFGNTQFPRYDRIINLDYSRGAGWLTSRIPAGLRQGGQINQQGALYFPDDWSSYVHAVAVCQNANPFNLIDLQRGMGGSGVMPASDAHSFVAMADDLPLALPQGRRVAINPGASEARRRWPAAQYAQLIRRLQSAGVSPVLVGSPDDRPLCRSIAGELESPVPDFSGRTTIPQMARLLHEVDLLVSNDTGAAHLAAAGGTRVVGLYEQVPYLPLTAPWSAGNLLLRSAAAGQPIPADVVFKAVMERLEFIPAAQLAAALELFAVEAWETAFLPEGCDPLGGLAYLPRHRHGVTAGQLSTLVLRHVLAWQFCGAQGALSSAWLASETSSNRFSLSPHLHQEAAELANMTVELVHRLEDLAGQAAAARRASLAGDVESLRQQTAQVSASLASLPRVPDTMPGLQLVLAFLDQKLSSTGHLPLPGILAAYEIECRRCAQALGKALELLVPVLERGLAASASSGGA